jgi:hypothetical protein
MLRLPHSLTLPRLAVAQSDPAPSLTVAVQEGLPTPTRWRPPREQSNVGYRISGLYAEPLIDTD